MMLRQPTIPQSAVLVAVHQIEPARVPLRQQIFRRAFGGRVSLA